MTFRDVYVGKLSDGPDPLDRGGTWSGNAPEREGCPDFPSHGAGDLNKYPFTQLVSRIEGGRYEGKQVDWGGWAAKVTKSDILQFVAEVYPDDYGRGFPHLRRQYDELLKCLHALSDEGSYALVAVEL